MANGKTLIRGAYVLTMDEALGTIRDGDVRIEGDRITAVGRGLAADGAEVIDGTDCIVLPGFVDTHRHMWGAMLRGCACYGDLGTYFHDVVFTYGANYTPEDTYASARFGLAEAVDAGITTLHAWEHNLQTRRTPRQRSLPCVSRACAAVSPTASRATRTPAVPSPRARRRSTSSTCSHSSAANSRVQGTCSTSASPVAAPSTPSRRFGSRSTPGRGSRACPSRRIR